MEAQHAYACRRHLIIYPAVPRQGCAVSLAGCTLCCWRARRRQTDEMIDEIQHLLLCDIRLWHAAPTPCAGCKVLLAHAPAPGGRLLCGDPRCNRSFKTPGWAS